MASSRLTHAVARRYCERVKRLELQEVRICKKCGRGRALLLSDDDDSLSIPLDPVRARRLAGERDDVRCLGDFLIDHLREGGIPPTDVVLDRVPAGLRALVSLRRGEEIDVLSCTAQEGLEIALRGDLHLYATADVFETQADRVSERDPGETLH